MFEKPKRKIQPSRLVLWPIAAAFVVAMFLGLVLGFRGQVLFQVPDADVPLWTSQTIAQSECTAWVQRPAFEPVESIPQSVDETIMPGGIPAPMPTSLPDARAGESVLPAPMAERAITTETGVMNMALESTSFYEEPATMDFEADTVAGGLDIAASDDLAYAEESAPVPASLGASLSYAAPLRAGEIDDNADWEAYQDYRRDYFQMWLAWSVLDVDVSGRQIIRVVDAEDNPVLGACVEVYHGETLVHRSQTYATGLTLFFPHATESTRYVEEFRVLAHKGDASAETLLDRQSITGALELELPLSLALTPQVDVMFLLDATGSMADEIQQLQENLLSITSQLDALEGDVDARYGLVAYRDRGEAYVTQVTDFTPDVQAFQQVLNQVQAAGGGDTPESLNQALDEALNDVSWRGEHTIKLIFLVADASPHLDYPNDIPYVQSMSDALARGIKIHPIASSNTDPAGEYIFRQLAQYTTGKFIFLTYEDGVSGVAGDDRTDLDVGDAKDAQGVGDYSVNQLDELVLKLITDELAALQGE